MLHGIDLYEDTRSTDKQLIKFPNTSPQDVISENDMSPYFAR